jgi:hypothetical protein
MSLCAWPARVCGGWELFVITRKGEEVIKVFFALDKGMTFFAVGNDDIFDRNGHIIAQNLPEYAAIEPFAYGLALNEHPGLGGFVKDEEVETFVELTQFHSALHSHIGGGIILYLQEILDKILTDPLFGSEADPLFAKFVPDLLFVSFGFFDLKGVFRVVDFDH